MRTFSSYGPVDTDFHYYAPREELIRRAYTQLLGENPQKGGHYITVWAPRQTGKSWVLLETMKRLNALGEYEIAYLPMQSAKEAKTDESALDVLVSALREWFRLDFPDIIDWKKLHTLFTPTYFSKPVILILDEFDAIEDAFINKFANEFRNMYMQRKGQIDKPDDEKSCLLHGLALIGVRSVLGIENSAGSPFNVQRSLHIPNLTFEEVKGILAWYQQESGQPVEPDVIDRIYEEMRGQPGLTCWFGELLTETYNEQKDRSITIQQFDYTYLWAMRGLPSNNVLNIISKAKQPPYKDLVLELFKTEEKIEFSYDEPYLSFLYLNGVIDIESTPGNLFAKFPSPFVQKRLFNYFSRELFSETGQLYIPFEDLSDSITEDKLHLRPLMRRYEAYLKKNRDWLLKDAPKRKDLRIFEAVYHFNLYMFLHKFFEKFEGKIYPEFPTGNGRIDLIVHYAGKIYALEIKSFTNAKEYQKALQQAAKYGQRLSVKEVFLISFVEYIDDANRKKYETNYLDKETGVTVKPVFVETGR